MQLFDKIKKQVEKIAGLRQVLKRIRPTIDFDIANLPSAPDYQELSNWAAHPERLTKVAYTPEDIEPTTAWKNGHVDCFYVYPTLNFSSQYWNAPLDHKGINELVDELILPGQVSVFNTCCRIFVPRYRQATFYSFLRTRKNGRAALEVAGADIIAAFDYYLANFNKGRPFFLAGHSQGSLHVMRLLEERIEGTALAKQLVAAYPIGFYFPMDKFKRTLKTIIPGKSPTTINCVVAWDTYLATGGPVRIVDRAEIRYSENGKVKWEKRKKKKVLGVNPLNWTISNELVSAKQHLGGVFLYLKSSKKMGLEAMIAEEPMGLTCKSLSKPKKEQVNAQIGKRGFLFVSKPKYRAFRRLMLPGGYLHVFDIALFYINLRMNIQERWNAYQTVYPPSE